jgi:hypothetical protein
LLATQNAIIIIVGLLQGQIRKTENNKKKGQRLGGQAQFGA